MMDKPEQPAAWWRKLKQKDPITLEPLSELPCPPFQLQSGKRAVHYFNGRSLADCLVSTGCFENPVTRQPLTRALCVVLDRHIKQHYPADASEMSVVSAFDDKKWREEQRSKVPLLTDPDRLTCFSSQRVMLAMKRSSRRRRLLSWC